MNKQIIQLLDSLQIKYRWTNHPAVYTVADLANLDDDSKPIKNLLLQEDDGNRKFLVIMAGEQRLNLKSLREKLKSKRLRFASDNTLLQTLGVTPGAVSVFGMIYKGSSEVEVVLDKKIIGDDEELGFHPNNNTATIFFQAKNIEPILQKIGCDYKIINLY